MPGELRALADLLRTRAQSMPERAVDIVGGRALTNALLVEQASAAASGLAALDVAPHAAVLIAVHDIEDTLALFWGALFRGAVPALVAAPRDAGASERARIDAARSAVGARVVVVDRGVADLAREGASSAAARVVDAAEVRSTSDARLAPYAAASGDVAFWQLSSGSTRAPTPVGIRHDNVLANIAQLAERLPISRDDVKLSWMPLFHDMGLIGAHLLPLCVGMREVRMDALLAMGDPLRWLQEAEACAATVLSSTCLGLARAARAVEQCAVDARPDLSRVRMVASGAEPLVPDVLRAFSRATGVPERAHFPMYGLAEATVGVAAASTTGLRTVMVNGRERVIIGPLLPRMEARVADDGELLLRGANVVQEHLDEDGWLHTGDLIRFVTSTSIEVSSALVPGGTAAPTTELVVVGRKKDLIIIGGRNVHPADIEALVESIAGVRAGGAVVVADTRHEPERAFVGVLLADDVGAWRVLPRVRAAVAAEIGAVPDVVALERMPRTTSGKKRRSEVRAQVQGGAFDSATHHSTRDLVRAAWTDALARRLSGDDDDTSFRDLGGTSIQATRVLALLAERGGVTPDHRILLAGPTIRRLASVLERDASEDRPSPATPAAGSAIAVIAMALRAPGAAGPRSWFARTRGNEFATSLDTDTIERFDNARFGIADDEASAMDPQQRLMLTVAADALARTPVTSSDTRVGVFVGACHAANLERVLPRVRDDVASLPPGTLAGNLVGMIATRVAHTFDLRGPALAVDTACSSSLVALHLACQSLRAGDCDAALVGGVQVSLTPTLSALLSRAGALSPSGTCRPFEPGADGTIPGDGCFAVLLAPLDSAERQGWPVLAVIRGSAVNNDGTSLGVMAPNPAGQEAVIRAALASSSVEVSNITQIEAHGTATTIGDSVERTVLGRIYGAFREGGPRVSASKGRVGHLMGAAGLAGFTSILGALREGEIGAVSSFGFGGTNAHVIVEGAWRRLPDAALDDGATRGERRSLDDLDVVLRRGALVVVTGASGALGRALVRALALLAVHAVLVGTRADDNVTRALCSALGEAGGSALWCSADLTTAEGGRTVARAVDELRRTHGGRSLDVLFHLAGTADAARAHEVKVGGLLRLERLDARATVLASSISASTAGLERGLEAYAAANRALDDYARDAPAAARVRAVALPALRAPDGAGLAGPHLRFLEERGVRVVDVAEGARMLLAALDTIHSLAPIPGTSPEAPRMTAAVTAAPGARAAPLARSPLPVGSPVASTQLLRDLVAAALMRDASTLDEDATFPSLGLDSLAAVDVVRRLEEALARELSSTLLYEHDTIAKATRAIDAGAPLADTTVAGASLAGASLAGAPLADTPVATDVFDAFAPLLPAQLSFIAQRALFPDMPGNVLLAVTLDVERPLGEHELRAALDVLVARHPALSSAVVHAANGAWLAARGAPPSLAIVVPGHIDEDATADEPFDLARGPLFRVVSDGRRLLLNGHHAAVDAWSVRNVMLELLELVAAARARRSPDFMPLASTIVEATRAVLHSRAEPADVEWFRARLVDAPPLHLRWRAPVDAPSSGGSAVAIDELSVDDTTTLRERAAAAGVTVPAWVLAAWMRALFDASGQHDLVVRVAHGKRTARVPDIERHVGAFADALPVRALVELGDDTAALARKVHAFLMEAQAHASVSAFDLADVLPRGAAGPVGLTPVGFSFPLLPGGDVVAGFALQDVVGRAGAGFSRATLVAFVAGGRLRLMLNHARSHLSGDDARALVQAAARHAVDAPCLTPPHTLHGRVLAQCAATPDRIAVYPSLTYGALALDSATIARALLDAVPALRGERVAVLASPSPQAAIALLGVLRTGAAYVPLDPHWPDERAADVLALARVSAIVAPPALAERARAIAAGVPVVVLGTIPRTTSQETAPNDDGGPHAYVMFTSGSTGNPKGVLVSHASCLTFQEWVQRAFGVSEHDCFAWTSSIAFGGSVRQVFSPLLAGASTHPVSHDVQRDPDAIVQLIHDNGITIWNSVPSLWLHLMDAAERAPIQAPFSSVRAVLIGGEPVPASHARRWLALLPRIAGTQAASSGSCRLFNLYGSVETIVNATWMEVVRAPADDELHCPIGWPRAGCSVTLDGAGEIVVGGAIADAYFDDVTLTRERFVSGVTGTSYRTGDLGQRRADGCFVHRGRVDDQVQVRGNRVELVEIEHTLAAHASVRRALVAWEGGRLLAAVEVQRAVLQAVRPDDLRAFVERKLPAFMVPHRIVIVDALPKTPAGKGDRKALARMFELPDERAAAAVGNDRLREAVASAWRRVLALKSAPRDDDDFFALGGDSIRALQVLDLVRAHVRGDVRPMQLYRHRRFADLVRALDETDVAPAPPERAPVTSARLTGVQRGFWLAHKATGRAPTWTAAVPLVGALDVDALARALAAAVARHPALRTVFAERAPGVVEQVVHAQAPTVSLAVDDLTALSGDAQHARIDALVDAAAQTAFSLEEGPLFAVRVARLSTSRHLLVLASHHIISDAWSFFVLLGEALAHIDGRAAPSTPALDLRHLAAREPTRASSDDEAYWRAALADLDVSRAASDLARSRSTRSHLDSDVLEAVGDEARVHGATPFTVVLAAAARALADVARTGDLVISVAVSGRGSAHDERARVVGPLARALPVRLRAPFTVARAAAALDEALAHADAPPSSILAAAGGHPHVLSRFFLSWLDPAAVAATTTEPTSITPAWQDARFAFAADATGTDVMIGAMPTSTGLTLHVHGGALVDDAVAALQRELRALATPTSALVVYAPSALREAARALREPIVVERVRSRLGLSELVLLPIAADHLAHTRDLDARVRAAVVVSTHARSVALAGMLPSLVGLGVRATTAPLSDVVTTGHAATVVAMFLTVRRVLRETGRDWSRARVAALGFGSIGRATFALCQAMLGEPAAMRIVDPDARDAAARFERSDTVDGCDLVLAASSGGATLDVDALAPGTIVVDDSFPRAFSDERAWARMRARKDVLLVGGGMLDAGALVRRSPFAEAEALRRGLPVRWLPGCHAEAFVVALRPALGPTRGLVDVSRARAMLDALDELGVRGAPLHLGADEIPSDVVAALR